MFYTRANLRAVGLWTAFTQVPEFIIFKRRKASRLGINARANGATADGWLFDLVRGKRRERIL